jgi:hypothetical protein
MYAKRVSRYFSAGKKKEWGVGEETVGK